MKIFILFIFLLPLPPNTIPLHFTISHPNGLSTKVNDIKLIGGLEDHSRRSQEVYLLPGRKYLLNFKYLTPVGYEQKVEFKYDIQYYLSGKSFFRYLDHSEINLKPTNGYWRDSYKVIKSDQPDFAVGITFKIDHPEFFNFVGDMLVKDAKIKLLGEKFIENP